MKKLISLTLIAIMLITATVLPISAADGDNEFTREEAEQLFYEAFHCYNAFQDNWAHDFNDHLNNQAEFDITWEDQLQVEHSNSTHPLITYRLNNFTICGKTYVINSVADVKDVAEIYYTPELAEKVMLAFSEEIPLFSEGDNGKAYYYKRGIQNWPNHFIDKYGDFTVNGDKATLEVYAIKKEGGTVQVHTFYYKAPIEFTKTSEGWRISGGDMFYVYSYQIEKDPYVYRRLFHDPDTGITTEIVNTGDETIARIALLVMAAVSAIIMPFACSKKKRAR